MRPNFYKYSWMPDSKYIEIDTIWPLTIVMSKFDINLD